MVKMLSWAMLMGLTSGVYAQTGAQRIAKDNNEFAVRMYKEIFKEERNVFMSPYSISSALAMTHLGAGGGTAAAMEKAMAWSSAKEAGFDKNFGELQGVIDGYNSKELRINVANSLWASEVVKFEARFERKAREDYKAEVRRINFGDKEAAAKTINKWVEGKTNDLIKDLISPSNLEGAHLVLVNAIYFYGDWLIAFDKEGTQKRAFKTSGGEVIEHDFMNMYGWRGTGDKGFRYMEDKNVQVLELPYTGDKASMIVVLPKKGESLADVAKDLSMNKLDSWLSGLEKPKLKLNISLPKWKMEYGFSAKVALGNLGMGSAFSDGADFSLMTRSVPLKIGDVLHKAFIKVEEEGTEAAAATAVIMVEITSVQPRAEPVINFIADRPFLYMIREKETGSILFMGQMVNPKVEK